LQSSISHDLDRKQCFTMLALPRSNRSVIYFILIVVSVLERRAMRFARIPLTPRQLVFAPTQTLEFLGYGKSSETDIQRMRPLVRGPMLSDLPKELRKLK
jgi:hypothetical protein